MRVTVKLQGEANAQALFDVMHGRAVCWKEGNGGGWQEVTFDHESVEEARAHVRELFPRLRFAASRWL
ncbi:hypothetical protein CPT_Paku_010 [Burkholderia phage Paku]|uniref:Uncharacterized protein n=1 Tax=Burkholderia phage Paku TaxID=2859650 RepID=A0AAE8BI57_9CAUD|nr:hypothetical protein CPT_Paku_010 [Burkholderia phage Paku]